MPRQSHINARKVSGYVNYEAWIGIALVGILMLGLLAVFNPFSDDEDISAYRSANAMYIFSALERQRVAALNFYDTYGALPGDAPTAALVDGKQVKGNGNGRIEASSFENRKFFTDLFNAKLNPVENVRVRGKKLNVLWTRLLGDGEDIGEGHYFKLVGLNSADAYAFDYKYDNGHNGSGDVMYVKRTDGTVTLYARFELFK